MVSTPPDWKPSPSSSKYTVLHQASPEGTDFVLTVIPAPQLSSKTSQDMMAQMSKQADDDLLAPIKAQFPTAKIAEREQLIIGNYDWYKTVTLATYKTPAADIDLTIWTVITLFEGKIFTMTFRSPSRFFVTDLETIKKIASTFQFHRSSEIERQIEALQ